MHLSRLCKASVTAAVIGLVLSFILLPGRTVGASGEETLPDEEHRILENLPAAVDGRDPVIIKTLHYSYPNNRFVSVRDFAAALNGTPKHFQAVFEDGRISLFTGTEYLPAGGECDPFPEEYLDPLEEESFLTFPLALNPVSLDGRPLHYRSFLGKNLENLPDCFISLTDLAMQLDIRADLEGGKLYLNTGEPFRIDPEIMFKKEFYYEIHSALLGDAGSGEVFASSNSDASVAVASTSKLMTYLVLMDLVSEGRISPDDPVLIPEEAALLSRTSDGEIRMEEGKAVSFTDLLTGMLVPSSDECALALAVHAAGSEAEFVRLMQQKASELHLSDATVFFNSHGLPVYSDDIPASKLQNRMSAEDMFVLVRQILNRYPQILEITSVKSTYLESFGITVENTNPLLYNLPGVVGLKTGTTNMAGDCVVGVMEVKDPDGRTHYLTVIQFGAEDETIRATLSEELLRYGQKKIADDGLSGD